MAIKQEAPQEVTFTAEEVAAMQETFRNLFKLQRMARLTGAMGLQMVGADDAYEAILPILNTVGQKIGMVLTEEDKAEKANAGETEEGPQCDCPACQLERQLGLK